MPLYSISPDLLMQLVRGCMVETAIISAIPYWVGFYADFLRVHPNLLPAPITPSTVSY